MSGVLLVGVFSLFLNCTQLDVPLYDQTVEYKTACESVATVASLNYLGYDITIDEFLDEYLDTIDPWAPEVMNSDGDIFDSYFVGDPRTQAGWMCNPSVICNGVDRYFSDIGETELQAFDTTGVEFSTLISEVLTGHPVVIWITHGCEETEQKDWYGSPYFARSHTVVLSGYDRVNQTVTLTDSVEGIIEFEYMKVKNNYEFAGKKSVVIK